MTTIEEALGTSQRCGVGGGRRASAPDDSFPIANTAGNLVDIVRSHDLVDRATIRRGVMYQGIDGGECLDDVLR